MGKTTQIDRLLAGAGAFQRQVRAATRLPQPRQARCTSTQNSTSSPGGDDNVVCLSERVALRKKTRLPLSENAGQSQVIPITRMIPSKLHLEIGDNAGRCSPENPTDSAAERHDDYRALENVFAGAMLIVLAASGSWLVSGLAAMH
jgi:hypothetical protein